jgi:hypothetical protein
MVGGVRGTVGAREGGGGATAEGGNGPQSNHGRTRDDSYVGSRMTRRALGWSTHGNALP